MVVLGVGGQSLMSEVPLYHTLEYEFPGTPGIRGLCDQVYVTLSDRTNARARFNTAPYRDERASCCSYKCTDVTLSARTNSRT